MTFSQIEHYLPYLSGVATFILGAYKDKIAIALNWKKQKKEIDGQQLDNLQKNLDLYQEMLTDLDTRYKAKIAQIETDFKDSTDRLKEHIKSVEELNNGLKKEIKEQKEFITKQRKSLKYFQDNCTCIDFEKTNNQA